MLDIQKIRADFPILNREVNGRPLVYFDNAATSQKPQQVIDKIVEYYTLYNANIHRGVHALSQEATDLYEEAREKVRAFFNIPQAKQVIITSGNTHSINAVASGAHVFVKKDDEIIVSAVEHHSNIVPWQMLCERVGATLKVIPVLDSGELDMQAYEGLLNEKTAFVVVNHVSNALGVTNPVEEIIKGAHEHGAMTLIDGAQSCGHMKLDMQALDADFYTMSGHKMCGPTGIGILYGKEEALNALPPYQGGGEMIDQVTFEHTTYAGLPHKFEAGTPNIAGGIALGAAVDYLNELGMDNIAAYEHELLIYATEQLKAIEGLKIYGDVVNKAAVISFNVTTLHPYDIGTIVDKLGIAVRTGHHCAQPVMERYSIPGTVRASFAFYNTKEEIDIMVQALQRAVSMLS
ncbi:aminotransferase class V-fold PLP-dependent enzyme [Nonlabens ulvanivorans]|uniref:Probable cysteine desulfurase n=2 Tax=Nonlabens ulvanivorans TaxID=906888 RepID=A0A084JTR6_NONUL|nr:cysteine desulfurase [Nonlabens ulvanivorans]KEZ92350.1 cysteine sulfinate desulfinase [Nonlabens ulvanivorans]PRX15183.1 cysteine desulfurase [Nonlabens ulvanivorans]